VEIALTDTTGLNENEQELVRRARDGDTEAFGTLVEKYMRRAYYIALGMSGSHEDALDLSQEAFVRAFRARKSLDPERPFYAWLYQIVRRLCFNNTRDRRTRTERLREARPWLVDRSVARHSGLDPARALEREEARARVRRGIELLPERLREVLVLKEFEGLRYREIADLVGIPIGTVMSRLYTARRKLAEVLEDNR